MITNMTNVSSAVSTAVPSPPDADFLYLGLTKEQVALLDGQPNHVRAFIYETALKRLMGIGTPEDLVGAGSFGRFIEVQA